MNLWTWMVQSPPSRQTPLHARGVVHTNWAVGTSPSGHQEDIATCKITWPRSMSKGMVSLAGRQCVGKKKTKHSCMERHTIYTPIMPGLGSVFDARGIGSFQEDMDSCRNLCKNTKSCAHWMMRFDPHVRHCLLADDLATKQVGVQRAVAGPPLCSKVLGNILMLVMNPESFSERHDVETSVKQALTFLARTNIGKVFVQITEKKLWKNWQEDIEKKAKTEAWRLEEAKKKDEQKAETKEKEGHKNGNHQQSKMHQTKRLMNKKGKSDSMWGFVNAEFEIITNVDPVTNTKAVMDRLMVESNEALKSIIGDYLPGDLVSPVLNLYVISMKTEGFPSYKKSYSNEDVSVESDRLAHILDDMSNEPTPTPPHHQFHHPPQPPPSLPQSPLPSDAAAGVIPTDSRFLDEIWEKLSFNPLYAQCFAALVAAMAMLYLVGMVCGWRSPGSLSRRWARIAQVSRGPRYSKLESDAHEDEMEFLASPTVGEDLAG